MDKQLIVTQRTPHVKYVVKYLLLFNFYAAILTLNSCNLFSTRNPEVPVGTQSNFLVPTSELIVISNFTNAIREKNIENFVACFSDTILNNAKNSYRFEPSSEAGSRFAAQFSQWTIQNERRWFFGLTSRLPSNEVPQLLLTSDKFDIRTPDSAVWVANYILTVRHTVASIPTVVSGTLRCTIVPNSLNQWSIERWVDLKSTNDSIASSWSTIKAQFSN